MGTKHRKCSDNDGNYYLVPESQADKFEELIAIEKDMGAQSCPLLEKELAKFDQYRVDS